MTIKLTVVVVVLVLIGGTTHSVSSAETSAAPGFAQVKPPLPDAKHTGSQDLQAAARAGDAARVKALLAQGVDANVAGDKGWTPLLFAARAGHVNVAETLLDAGANIDAESQDAATPLILATLMAGKPLVELLVRHGASIDFRNRDGLTAWDVAEAKKLDALAGYLAANRPPQWLRGAWCRETGSLKVRVLVDDRSWTHRSSAPGRAERERTAQWQITSVKNRIISVQLTPVDGQTSIEEYRRNGDDLIAVGRVTEGERRDFNIVLTRC